MMQAKHSSSLASLLLTPHPTPTLTHTRTQATSLSTEAEAPASCTGRRGPPRALEGEGGEGLGREDGV